MTTVLDRFRLDDQGRASIRRGAYRLILTLDGQHHCNTGVSTALHLA
jgi:hypothetical protein